MNTRRLARSLETIFLSAALSILLLPQASGAEQKPPETQNCENIKVKGRPFKQAVDHVKQRSQSLCGKDGKGGKVSEAAKMVGKHLDKCTVPGDPEGASISLKHAFDNSLGERASQICGELGKQLDEVNKFCQKQSTLRSGSKRTIDVTAAEAPKGASQDLKGQYNLHNRVVSAHSLAKEGAQSFLGQTKELKKKLEEKRRKGKQSSENAAHSEDEVLRKQEGFFLGALQKRTAQFENAARTEKDPKKRQQFAQAAQACKAIGQPNGAVVAFRKAMENNILPNHENLYKMSDQLEKQAEGDLIKADAEEKSAIATRDKFKNDDSTAMEQAEARKAKRAELVDAHAKNAAEWKALNEPKGLSESRKLTPDEQVRAEALRQAQMRELERKQRKNILSRPSED
jgi:hypothetical protein